jgi:metaxin
MYHQHAANVVSARFGVSYVDGDLEAVSMLETAVIKGAEECLTMLSQRLGTEPYLFGQAPTSADAILYGYLAPLLKAPFPNPSLQNYLKACDNLVNFVVRISSTYFAKIALDYEKKDADIKKQNKASNDNTTSSDSSDKTRPIIAGCVAASAMIGYAYASGLVDVVRNSQIVYIEGGEDVDGDEDADEEDE